MGAVERQWGKAVVLPWITGTLLVAALVAPWYWAVERHPRLLDYFLIGEH
jgi:4-amino-4-deoxy-L-arabinose transferase-like glycosyltransferase